MLGYVSLYFQIVMLVLKVVIPCKEMEVSQAYGLWTVSWSI